MEPLINYIREIYIRDRYLSRMTGTQSTYAYVAESGIFRIGIVLIDTRSIRIDRVDSEVNRKDVR